MEGDTSSEKTDLPLSSSSRKQPPIVRLLEIMYEIVNHECVDAAVPLCIGMTPHDFEVYLRKKFSLKIAQEDLAGFFRGHERLTSFKYKDQLAEWGVHKVDNIEVPAAKTMSKKVSTSVIVYIPNQEALKFSELNEEDIKELPNSFKRYLLVPVPPDIGAKVTGLFPNRFWNIHRINLYWPTTISSQTHKIEPFKPGMELKDMVNKRKWIDLNCHNDQLFCRYYHRKEEEAMKQPSHKRKCVLPAVDMRGEDNRVQRFVRMPIRTGTSKRTAIRKVADYESFLMNIPEADRELFLDAVKKRFKASYHDADKKEFLKDMKFSMEKTQELLENCHLSASKLIQISYFLKGEYGFTIFPCPSRIYQIGRHLKPPEAVEQEAVNQEQEKQLEM